MPNIATYDAPIKGLTPSDKGIEAYVQSGRRIGLFYHQIGEDVGNDISTLGDQYVKHQDQQVANQYETESSNAETNYAVNLSKFMNAPQDPNNPDGPKNYEKPGAALAFYQNSADQIDKLADHARSVASPELGERILPHAEEVKKGMLHQALAMDSAVTAQNALSGLEKQASNAASQAAAGMPLDTIIDNFQGGVNTAAAAITSPEDRIKFLRDANQLYVGRVVQSAVEGITSHAVEGMDGSPGSLVAADAQFEKAREVARDPKYDEFIGLQRQEIISRIDEAQRQARSANMAVTNEQRMQAEADGNQAVANFNAKYVDANGQPAPGAKGVNEARIIAERYGAYSAAARDLPLIAGKQVKDQHDGLTTIDDPNTRAALMQDPNLDAHEVNEAFLQGKISDHTRAVLTEAANGLAEMKRDPMVNQGLETMHHIEQTLKPTISSTNPLDPTAGKVDIEGDQAYSAFVAFNLEHFQVLAKQLGPQQAINKMTNPADPEYIGKRAAMWQRGGAYRNQASLYSAPTRLPQVKGKTAPPPLDAETAKWSAAYDKAHSGGP